jgi:uncharacterized protein
MKIFNHTNYPKATIRLKPSKVVKGGVGAFTQKNFKKGEIVVNSEEFEDDNVMSVDEYNKLDKETKELVKAHSTIEIDKLYIPANLNHIKPINYFNHSCNPNIGFDSDDNYVAIKNISKGAELLLDYSFLNSNSDYKMKCSCGSKNCRKVITGNEWKNKKFTEKNKKHFVSSLRKIL